MNHNNMFDPNLIKNLQNMMSKLPTTNNNFFDFGKIKKYLIFVILSVFLSGFGVGLFVGLFF